MKGILVISFLLLATINCTAKTIEFEGVFYNLDDSLRTAMVIQNLRKGNYCGNISIPAIVTDGSIDYEVIGISYRAFQESGITHISLPSTIRRIEEEAFQMSKLNCIVIPQNVNHVGKDAFNKCTELKAAVFKCSKVHLSEAIFRSCKKLEKIQLPDSLDFIPAGFCCFCPSLRTIDIPSSVRLILTAAFGGCTNLRSIKGMGRLEGIGYTVFAGCSNLEQIHLPKTISVVGGGAFEDCDKLKDIFCYAEKVPKGEGINAKNATLHVPRKSLKKYKKSGTCKVRKIKPIRLSTKSIQS